MSRTYKDKPHKFSHPEDHWEYKYEDVPYTATRKYWANGEWVEGEYNGVWLRNRPGVLTKKKKRVDTEWHWMSTPSWWTHVQMIRPQRRASKKWEKDIVRMPFWDIAQDNFDPPIVGKKPHIYYW